MALGAFLTGYQLLRLGPINFTLSDLMFVLAFAISLSRGQITALPFGTVTPWWLTGIAMMLGGLFIGTLFNGDLVRWIVIACQYATGFLILPMLLMAQPLRIARRLIAMFILGMVVMESFGIIASLTMTHAQAAAIFSEDFLAGNGRLSSFASEPNWNGSLIALTAPLLIYAYISRLIPLWAVTIIAPILAWALMLSASFTGFAAAMIAMSITLLFIGARYLGGVLLVAGVAASIFVASGAPLPSIFEKRVGSAISNGDIEEAGTYKGRVRLIKLAWQDSEHTLIVGLGVDKFRTTNAIKQPVHNLPLLMLVEGGLLALSGLLLLIVLLLWMPISRLATHRAEAGVALSVVTVFIIYAQSSPHMFSRMMIVPVLLALMILFESRPQPIQTRYATKAVRRLRSRRAEIAH